MLTQSALKNALLINLLFGYALIAANPETTRVTYEQEQSSCSHIRIVRHLANYGYLYVLAAATAVVGIFAHRNAKRNFAQRLAELQKLGFSNAEKMANAMSGEKIETLKGLLNSDRFTQTQAKQLNKAYSAHTIQNALYLLEGTKITVTEAFRHASKHDSATIDGLKAAIIQGPEAVTKFWTAHEMARATVTAAEKKAQGMRDAAWWNAQGRIDAAHIQNAHQASSGVVIRGNGNTVRV